MARTVLKAHSNNTFRLGRGNDDCLGTLVYDDANGRIESHVGCTSGSKGYAYYTHIKEGTYAFVRARTYEGHMRPQDTESEQIATGLCNEIEPTTAKKLCSELGHDECSAFDQSDALILECDLVASLGKDNKRGATDAWKRLVALPPPGKGGHSLIVSASDGTLSYSSTSLLLPEIEE